MVAGASGSVILPTDLLAATGFIYPEVKRMPDITIWSPPPDHLWNDAGQDDFQTILNKLVHKHCDCPAILDAGVTYCNKYCIHTVNHLFYSTLTPVLCPRRSRTDTSTAHPGRSRACSLPHTYSTRHHITHGLTNSADPFPWDSKPAGFTGDGNCKKLQLMSCYISIPHGL
jgi:hypothetical protein